MATKAVDSFEAEGKLATQRVPDTDDAVELVDPLAKEFECPLCLQILQEPSLTSCCGRHFCRACIDRVLKDGKPCPLCKEEGVYVMHDKSVERKIRSLEVHCRMRLHGCEWVGELRRLDAHLDKARGDCGFVEVECEFGQMGCKAKVLRKDVEKHMTENANRHLLLVSALSLDQNRVLERKIEQLRSEFQEQLSGMQFQFQQLLQEREHRLLQLQQEVMQCRIAMQ